MRTVTLLTLTVLLASWDTQEAFALATETKGNEPLSAVNYMHWKGIMPVVNDKAHVYQIWVNGNEWLFHRGTTKELNSALAHFSKTEMKNHVVVLSPGPALTHSFDRTDIPYNWALGLEWQKDPLLTVYVGGDIDLDKIDIPNGVTLRAAAGKTDLDQRIAAFLNARKSGSHE